MLTQIQRRKGEILRVPRGETPIIELNLTANHVVVSAELEEIDPYGAHSLSRKTVDWRFVVFTAWTGFDAT